MSKINVTKLPKSEIEIEGELDAELFEAYWTKALKKIGEKVSIPGFRKGKIPENVLLSNIPEAHVLEEMAEMALADHYPKIVEEHKIDAISRPEIAITKLARKNPLGFKIKTAVLPEIKLPDYKAEAKNALKEVKESDKNPEVTEEEVENTIMDIRKSRAPKKHMAEHAHDDSEAHKKEHEEAEKAELPEFNDEFVQAMGPFKDVADFKAKLRENIKLEKANLAREKTRLSIIEKIIDKSKLEVPEILIDVELDKILYRMESDITQMGLKFEDYLTHLKKSKEDLRKDFRGDAEKKAKLALVLNEIAKAEKIEADEADVEKEVSAILEHYKDADPERARMHAENVLTNEKIFRFLESQ